MKKYRVGGSRFVTFFMIIWCLFVSLFFFLMLSANDKSSLAIIVPIIMEVFGLIILISNIVGFRRMKFALQGHDATGKVINFYCSGRTNGVPNYVILFEYETESNETAICKAVVRHMDFMFFEVGKTIPIKVNGKYAYYDVKAMRDGNNNQSYSYNDSSYDSSSFGIHYCNKCGAKVSEDSDYCSNCGNRLK